MQYIDKDVYKYFRKEIEKQAFVSTLMTGVGSAGVRTADDLYRAFNPLTRTKNLNFIQRQARARALKDGDLFGPGMKKGREFATNLANKSSNLVQQGAGSTGGKLDTVQRYADFLLDAA